MHIIDFHAIYLIYTFQCSKPETNTEAKGTPSPTKLEVPTVQRTSDAAQKSCTVQRPQKCKLF